MPAHSSIRHATPHTVARVQCLMLTTGELKTMLCCVDRWLLVSLFLMARVTRTPYPVSCQCEVLRATVTHI